MNPVSHDDLRHMENRLGQRIDSERAERLDQHDKLRGEVMDRVDRFHSENKSTLATINETTKGMAVDMAELRGKLLGGKATASDLLRGFGWVIATGLAILEIVKRH